MKKYLLLFVLVCFTFSLMGCNLVGDVSGTTPPTSDDGKKEPCKHAELKTLEGIDATCTETGLTEGKECVYCDEIIQAQNVIGIKSHSYDDREDKVCNSCGFLNSNLPTFVVSEIKTTAGNDNIAVTISLKNNPGIASIILSVMYDSLALELTEVEYNTEIGGQTVYPQELQSPTTVYWINAFADTTGDWVFATLYFDVSDDAVGEYNINISYEPDNVYNIVEENLNVEIINGKIVVK